MAVTMIEERGAGVIDLRGHRLGDLVRLLSGCGAADAELAVASVGSGAALAPEEALDALATALIQVRRAGEGLDHERAGHHPDAHGPAAATG
jgi:hypothetical protein